MAGWWSDVLGRCHRDAGMPTVSFHQAGGSGSGTSLLPRICDCSLIFPSYSSFLLCSGSNVAGGATTHLPVRKSNAQEPALTRLRSWTRCHTALSGCAQLPLGKFQG